MSLLCHATSAEFVWKQIKTIDFTLGDEEGDDWLSAAPHILKAQPRITRIVWRSNTEPLSRWIAQNPPTVMCLTRQHIEFLAQMTSQLRLLSIGRCDIGDQTFFGLHKLFERLDSKVIEEISVCGWLKDATVLQTKQFPNLRSLCLEVDNGVIGKLLEPLKSNFPALQELRLRFRDGDDASHRLLSQIGDVCRALKSLQIIDIPYFLLYHYLPHHQTSEELSTFVAKFGLDLVKLNFAGCSFWGQFLGHNMLTSWSSDWEKLFDTCYPHQMSLCQLNDLLVPLQKTTSSALSEQCIEWFIFQLQKWGGHFAKVDMWERPLQPGWTEFCDCLGLLYHIAGTYWSDQMRQLLVLCPSVLDVVTVRDKYRFVWSAMAITTLIIDVAWWKQNKKDFNLSENPAVHPIHYMCRSGLCLEYATSSALLDWDLKPFSQHFFVSMIQRRHLCVQNEARSYESALITVFERLKETQQRPLLEPLTNLEIATLSSLGPLHETLAILSANWKPIVSASEKMDPNQLFICMRRVDKNLPNEAILAAATAYWRSLVAGRSIPQLGHAAIPQALDTYTRDLVKLFPVLPSCAIALARAPPKRLLVYIYKTLHDILKERKIDLAECSGDVFL